MVVGDAGANEYARQVVRENFANVTVENAEDIMGIWAGQGKVKFDLNKDAMDEIKPYLEQGV